VQLCGERLVVADLGGEAPAVLHDRCLHRSTRLSLGWVDGGAIQCAYHGWRWDAGGRCVGIPSLPEGPLPARRIASYRSHVAYGLVWVLLDETSDAELPACPPVGDPRLKAVPGEPYTWPTSVERRVENFVDLAHFAWVHDGSLGDRAHPEVPVPEIRREGRALRFAYLPPALPDSDPAALLGASDYTVTLPGTVCIDFDVAGVGRRVLWMTASPIDAGACRTFWFTARSDDLDGDDGPHLAFQQRVLDEDRPVIEGQDPPWIPWDGDDRELSVSTDAVSLAYRRLLLDTVAELS
jgi:vanillate O-demethylase monooxygenase subunit